jgi:hypothetical protein
MHVCCLFWNELLERTQLKSRRIRVALESIDGLKKYGKEVRLREYEEWLKEFLQTTAIHQLAENFRQKIYPSIFRSAARTISRWHTEFQQRGFSGWNLSLRGNYERKFLLTKINIGRCTLEHEFKLSLAVCNDITTTRCQEWISNVIKNNFPDNDPMRAMKISLTCIYQCIKRLGAKYLERKKTYYHDAHQADSTVHYRNNV